MNHRHLFALLTTGILAAAAASALAQTQTVGGLLRDDAGKTLYTFDHDAPGESRCSDGCAAAWPPFMAAEGAVARAPLTLHARKTGGHQWGWNGKPLYGFAGDAKPGDTNGDGKGGTWHTVSTSGSAQRSAAVQPAGDPYKY